MSSEKRYTGVIVFDDGRKPGTINFLDNLKYLCEKIGCHTLDIPRRYVGGMEYRVIVDDTGLIDGRPITAIHSDSNAVLVGTLIFTNYTVDGEDFRDLTQAEIDNIARHIVYLPMVDVPFVTDLTFHRP